MAAAASPGRTAAAQNQAQGEQVPWPFPMTSREVSSISSLTLGSEMGNTNNNNATPAAVPQAPAPGPVPAPVPTPAPAAEQPLSRLEQLKLKKRQLETGGAPAAPSPPKLQASPVPPPPPPPPPAEPMAEKENQQPAMQTQAMDRGAPVNGNSLTPPSQVTVQIMNSSTKRVKELQLPIAKDTNLFAAVYDNKSVKQANVRKWGTSFVQQVKEKKSEIRCRVSILSNPPNGTIISKKPKVLDLAVSELQTTTTSELYKLYQDHFYPQRSKIQMLLVCQPVSNGEGGASENKLVAEPETTPIVSATPAAPPKPAEAKKEEDEEQVQMPIDRSSITSIASTLKGIKHQLRIKIINERTRYFKDLLVETSQQINLYEAIYNNPAVKEAKVRKWNSSIVEQVRSGQAEIVCQICTIPNGKPEHLVKHGILTIDQLKECSTTQLYTRYAMDHYDLDNDESLIQLVLKCQQIKTPIASNQASKVQDQSKIKTPTRLSDSLPPATPQTDASRGNPVLETPPVPSRPTHPRRSPTEGSQSSLSSMEKKPTNSPYAFAASAALPMHNTETKFSDLYPQQRPSPASPPAAQASPVHADPELGQVVRPIPTHPKKEAAVQTTTSMEITTPVRDNRQNTAAQQQPLTFADKLQNVDAFWWLAIIFILAAAFFAALFLGPIN